MFSPHSPERFCVDGGHDMKCKEGEDPNEEEQRTAGDQQVTVDDGVVVYL